MDTNRITGLALAVSPAVAIIIWFVIGFVILDGVGPDTPQKYIAEMGANSTAITYLIPLVTLLFLIGVAGIGYIKKTMEGGPGSYIAGFAWFLIIIGGLIVVLIVKKVIKMLFMVVLRIMLVKIIIQRQH